MSNDLDTFMDMDPSELAKNDAAIDAVILYTRRHRANLEEGKGVRKDAPQKLTGLAERLREINNKKAPVPQTATASGLKRL